MSCPKCGNKHPIDLQHMVFYPYLSKEESNKMNYDHSECQMCGHKWNKYRLGETK